MPTTTTESTTTESTTSPTAAAELVPVARAIAAVDLANADLHAIGDALHQVTRLVRIARAVEIGCIDRLRALADIDPTIDPERTVAGATRRSSRAAARIIDRAADAGRFPHLRARLSAGEIDPEHLDAFAVARRALPARLRPHLEALEAALADDAATMTSDEFRERLAGEARRIEGDDGAGHLRRQRRRIGARTWTDRDGMWNLHGRFDPERALPLIEALRRATEARFHAEHPADAPDDPVLRHQFLQALALADLIGGCGDGSRGTGTAPPEFIVTIDERTLRHGRHRHSRVDCGHGIHLPVEALQAIAGRARFVPVVIDRHGVVIAQGRPVPSLDQLRESLAQPVPLDLGRARRHASREQRRALRAMYRTCAVPGCDRHVACCEPHHVDLWAHGGRTDLARLLPLCKHHHDRLHAERWILDLRADRTLVIRRDGATIMTTGPPSQQWARPAHPQGEQSPTTTAGPTAAPTSCRRRHVDDEPPRRHHAGPPAP